MQNIFHFGPNPPFKPFPDSCSEQKPGPILHIENRHYLPNTLSKYYLKMRLVLFQHCSQSPGTAPLNYASPSLHCCHRQCPAVDTEEILDILPSSFPTVTWVTAMFWISEVPFYPWIYFISFKLPNFSGSLLPHLKTASDLEKTVLKARPSSNAAHDPTTRLPNSKVTPRRQSSKLLLRCFNRK